MLILQFQNKTQNVRSPVYKKIEVTTILPYENYLCLMLLVLKQKRIDELNPFFCGIKLVYSDLRHSQKELLAIQVHNVHL